jgi:hypothetical protein
MEYSLCKKRNAEPRHVLPGCLRSKKGMIVCIDYSEVIHIFQFMSVQERRARVKIVPEVRTGKALLVKGMTKS